MASSSKLHTCGVMAAAVGEVSTGGTTAGYSIHSAFDFNPDTYWKSNGAATQVVDIDLGAAKEISNFALWWHNYLDSSFTGGSMTAILASDDNDDGDYTATTNIAALVLNSANAVPILMDDVGGSAKRYWRVTFSNMPGAIEISQFFLVVERQINQGHQWPDGERVIYKNRVYDAPSGRQFVTGMNSGSFRVFPRTYLFCGNTAWTAHALKLAFDDCKGQRYPLILEEDSTFALCRFGESELDRNEIAYRVFNPSFTLIEVPYIRDGETF